MITPFAKAAPILAEIEKAGFEAYFVGGSVRDYILQKEIDDVDIASSATPEEIKAIFSRTIDVGIEHGTVIVLYNGDTYEITTFRTESEYEDFRRPSEVAFVRSLNEDLKRRDFTMNAIAMDKDGQLYDPFKGQEAIKTKIISTVGKPQERFQEDALRMMRAVRFVSQLSFSIEKATYQALIDYGSLLNKISIERITVEFEKLLKGNNRKDALNILVHTDLYQYLPGMGGYKKELNQLSNLEIGGLRIEEMWALLIFCMNIKTEDIESFLKKWRLPMILIKRVEKLCKTINTRLGREWTVEDLFNSNRDIVISTERVFNTLQEQATNLYVEELKQRYDNLPIKNRSELEITGSDLMEWFNRKGGPWIHDSLTKVEKAILSKEIVNRKETIKEWLMQCNQN